MKKISKYLKNLNEQTNDVHLKIMEFFKHNTKPSDEDVHSFASSLGIDEHEFEEHIYMIMGSIFGAGRALNFTGNYDSEQLKMGVKVEMEHTTDPIIAERIAKDHLSECFDYYTRLDKMEKECGVEE